MQPAKPGTVTLLVSQYGAPQPQPIQLQAFSEAARLDSFTLHAGDTQGILRGTRLDEVASLMVKGMAFMPGRLSSSQGIDQLPMIAADTAATVLLQPGDPASAKVTLKDGRVLDLIAAVDAPRPRVVLIGKSAQMSPTGSGGNIQLASQDELPQDAKLTFSVRTQSPAAFAYDEKIEVAAVNKSSSTTLGFDNGGMPLVVAQVAVATLDPARAFGPSTFGPLQFRIITHDATGDWQPLATLVRLPTLSDLKCPATRELACKLSGSSLFLVDAVSGNPQFDHAVQVPDGFPGNALPVPRPIDGQLYVKLRDDPSAVNATTLIAQQLPPSADEVARADVRHAAASPAAPSPDGEPGGSTSGVSGPPAPAPRDRPAADPAGQAVLPPH